MITIESDLWTRLADCGKPVVLYGTGNGADKIMNELERLNIPVAGIFASDGFVRKRIFRGFEVLSYTECREKFPDMTVLFCFGSSRPEVLENVRRIASENDFYAPDVPVYGENIFNSEFYKKHKSRLNAVRNMLADEQSVRVFDCIIAYRLTGDIKYLFECETVGDGDEILHLPENVNYYDFGAFTGDTALEFSKNHPDYRSITAVEPDRRNFRKLSENTANLRDFKAVRAVVSDSIGTTFLSSSKGMGNHEDVRGDEIPCVTVDSLVPDGVENIFIKADVEGNELKMIKGAENTIRNKAPYMIIDCYHRSEDIFTLPEAVTGLNPNYKIYMRHRPYIPAWETMFFFVPEKHAVGVQF